MSNLLPASCTHCRARLTLGANQGLHMGPSIGGTCYLPGIITATETDFIKESAFWGSSFHLPLGTQLSLKLGVVYFPPSQWFSCPSSPVPQHGLEEQSPTLLTPGTGFVEDKSSTDGGGVGDVLGIIQVHCIYWVLYFYYDYSSSTSDHQVLDPGSWGPWSRVRASVPGPEPMGESGENSGPSSTFSHTNSVAYINSLASTKVHTAAAAAAKSLQSCPTLCDPIDGSPPGSPVPGILQARSLEWVAISFSNAWKWKVEVKSLRRVRLFAIPWTAAYQVPLSMGFSRQEYWSGTMKKA